MSSRPHYHPEQLGAFGNSSSASHYVDGAYASSYPQPPAYGADPASTSYNRDRKDPPEFWYLGTRIPDPSLHRVAINTQKYPGYDPRVDWERLQAMIEVRPINQTSYDVADPVRGEPVVFWVVYTAYSPPRTVAGLLLTLSTFQRDALNDYAVVVSGGDLCHWMEKHPAQRGFRARKA